MRKVLLQLLVILCLFSCNSNEEAKVVEPTRSFSTFLDGYYKARLNYFPVEATFAGIEGYNHLFPNFITEAYRTDLRGFYGNYRDSLAQYNRNKLTPTEQTSFDVLKWECEVGLQGLEFPDHLTPIDQMWSPNLLLGQLAGGTAAQPFKTVKDYQDWLMRVDGFLIFLDSAMVNMRTGIAQGWVLPTALIQKVIPQIKSLTTGAVTEHLYFSPAKIFPASFTAEEKSALTTSYTAMVKDKVMPMHVKLAKFLEEEYLPKGRSSSGINALAANGKYYDYRIKLFTTTSMTADSIFELGKSEVARISAEMEKVKSTVGFTGDLKSFFEHVRNNKALMPFTKPEEVIANFNAIHERMKPQLQQLFSKVPRSPFEVRRTEAFREASASAEYNAGSKDGTRPGIFYVPIPDVKKYNLYSDESLFLHEAIPGHHYQISLQQENDSLPEFRKTLWYSAYGEGWALYTESLGKELGLYTDPYQYFGMLGAEMHRAVRLVVDAGMHTKGWTRDEAIKYCLENEAESEESITSEIERYMAMPGQALSYKIGQIKILQLREKSKKELGSKFNIQEFHNNVLEPGCIPLDLLEARINAWIQQKKG